MNLFPQDFVHVIIVISLIWTAISAVSLVVMLINDWRNGKIW